MEREGGEGGKGREGESPKKFVKELGLKPPCLTIGGGEGSGTPIRFLYGEVPPSRV